MELKNVVRVLDEEFNVDEVKDDWSFMFDNLFVRKAVASFRKPEHNTGLLIANSNEVNMIYTAFAPSRYVLEAIHMKGIVNVLLVVKHPFDWDGSRNGPGFIPFTERDYQLMEGMGISIYSLHTPMDKNRNDDVVSTAHAFSKVIKMRVVEEFASDEKNPDLLLGLIGKVQESKLDALVKRINSVLDYKVKVMRKSDKVGTVAVVTGGGFIPEIVQEAIDRGVGTYITGVISPNASEWCKKNYAKAFSEISKMDINVIGCSHYLTEKWAMEFSIPYFGKICKSEFIEDKEAWNLLE
ncbi:MAG: Nif3-like dinuclear metal center hexameric protein [archaeon]